MKRWLMLVLALLGALLAATASPSELRASARVDITELTMPAESTAKLEKTLRTLLHRAAKPLNFGGGKRIEVTVRLTELSFEESNEVVRVTCTLVGRLKGGGTARSHISFGGSPKKRKELERQVLAMVSDGVMSRLAEMARVREALEKKKSGAEPTKDKTQKPGGQSRSAKGPEGAKSLRSAVVLCPRRRFSTWTT